MEYLTRILNEIAKSQDFEFHPLCKNLSLVNLCFADDLMMFCKASPKSVNMLMKGFEKFTDSSGLSANPSKSSIFLNGVNNDTREQIKNLTNFPVGSFPVRYLGMPLSPTKWSKGDCQFLVDKMTMRIRSWATRHLSFAGRCQLINSVLFSMQTYWANIFMFPKTITKKIEAICRAFLWGQKENGRIMAYVNWDKVCLPKKHGGLGIIKCDIWNEAAIAKHIWDIASKADNLWVKWVDGVYLKGKNIWEYNAPNDAGWYWKKLNNIKQKFAPGYVNMKWTASNTGRYTLSSGYLWLRGEQGRFRFDKIVWSKISIPKHAFFMWLTVQRRLFTKARMLSFQIPVADLNCILCGEEIETVEHLFFHCQWSRSLLVGVCDWMGVSNIPFLFSRWRGWLSVTFRKDSCFRKTLYAGFAAVIYHVWRERNARIHENKESTIQNLLSSIKFELRARCSYYAGKNLRTVDRNFLLQIGVIND